MYATRYGQNIAQILSAYPPGVLQVKALEILISTVKEHALSEAKDTLAQSVCEGLHTAPPSGVKCLSCYNAEKGFSMQMSVEADMAVIARERLKQGQAGPWEPEPEVLTAEPLPDDQA